MKTDQIFVFFVSTLLMLGRTDAQGQSILNIPCDERPHALDQPWIPGGIACLEEVIHDPTMGELSFTALAVGEDGTLYATMPLEGQVVALTDTDNDLLPDAPTTIAEGLTRPNGLTFADGALYISAHDHVYRYSDDTLQIIAQNVPAGAGYWTGGLSVRDGVITVATGVPCANCPPDPLRGALVEILPNGEQRAVTTGLTQPNDVVWVDDQLYGVDTVRDVLFNSVGDVLQFERGSRPLGIAYYDSDAIPQLTGKLLVTLSGSVDEVHLSGYTVVTVDPQTLAVEALMPARPFPDDPASDFTNEEMNLRGSGFFPQRPLDVAVSPEGWVYISISGGRILALRPFVTP